MARCVCGEHRDWDCPPECMVGAFNQCRYACETQDHKTYAECLRAARLGIGRGESAPAQY